MHRHLISCVGKSHFFLFLADNKCYGIKPGHRKDCGYYGIHRYECEIVRDCCFVESMVPGIPWCFKGMKKLPKKAPPTAPFNETTVEPTEVSNGTTAAPTTASSNQTAAALVEEEQAFEEANTA